MLQLRKELLEAVKESLAQEQVQVTRPQIEAVSKMGYLKVTTIYYIMK